MERKWIRVPIMVLGIVLSAAAFVLRSLHPASGGLVLAVLSAVAVVLFAVCARLLQPGTTYGAGNSRSLAQLIVGGLSGFLALIGGLVLLAEGNAPVIAVGVLVVAFCWLSTVYLRQTDRTVSVWLYTIPALFFALELIMEFRHWGGDPQIMHYCYELLGLICAMFAVFHMGSFCFEQGKRRLAVFACLCGIFFSSAALADLQDGRRWMQAATILWLGINAWQLLRPMKKAE